VVVKKAKINFEILPVNPGQFVILDLESEKKQSPVGGRAPKGAPSVFGYKIIWGEIINIRVLGYEEEKGEGQDDG